MNVTTGKTIEWIDGKLHLFLMASLVIVVSTGTVLEKQHFSKYRAVNEHLQQVDNAVTEAQAKNSLTQSAQEIRALSSVTESEIWYSNRLTFLSEELQVNDDLLSDIYLLHIAKALEKAPQSFSSSPLVKALWVSIALITLTGFGYLSRFLLRVVI